MQDVVESLESHRGRGACTDAERRAALWVHDDLRARGYEPWVETVWVRPQWAWSAFWHAGLGVAVSLAATAEPLIAVGAVLLAVSWVLGGLTRLFYRRATEVVVVEPPADGIKLWLVAHTDAPRSGAGARWLLRLRPTPALAALLLSVAAIGGLRALGAEGQAIGAVQLVPTVALLAVAALALDTRLSPWSPGTGDAAGVAVALALHEELTRRPPARFSVGLVLGGAGEAWPLAFRHWLRSEPRSSEDTVIVELGPCGSGTVAWDSRHPQILAAAGGSRTPVRRPTARSRRLGWLYVRTEPTGAPSADEATMAAAYDFVLDTVDKLDTALLKTPA